MEIRAITYFCTLNTPETTLPRVGAFLAEADRAFQAADVRVQSRRVAGGALNTLGVTPADLPLFAARLRQSCDAVGIRYAALGVLSAGDDPAYLSALVDVFGGQGIFASAEIASYAHGINLAWLGEVAAAKVRFSRLAPDGGTNLYFCGSANVPSGTPFFPAAYHDGGAERFALAIEAADLAYMAFRGAGTPDQARRRLIAFVERAAAQLVPIAEQLAAAHGVAFGGLDFSFAPYPGEQSSLAAAMEHLGVQVGGAGALAAAALIMNAVEAADFPRCGFSGLMLPVLEDTRLGERAAEGALSVNDLLLYSAVCGTGLDCIPLAGDVPTETLAAILLDVASLALRLDKPLTARLMPLPNKQVGDPTDFTFEYFVPSRVMAVRGSLASGAFGSGNTFTVQPR
ncbi:MAG: DUF711 family protein [Chloroflexi bacterium CFX4]|nr:DUF711 family protein [Chloroflexi bacterium CFX4]MDL1922416.1 DUF711 family protein [Chloroflexi bacterium CFX3]